MPTLTLRHILATAALMLTALALPLAPPESNVSQPSDGNVMCCDGTESRTCAVKKPGCCSRHGGVCD